MGSWQRSLIIAVAILAATTSVEARMGGMGGRPSGGFRGFHGFHSRAVPFRFHQFNFALASPRERFGNARFEGWGGGAYSGDVAGFDYDENDDFAPEDLHFRAQDSFGPGDIGRESPPPEPYDGAPWDASRMEPRYGYAPDRW